LFNRFNNNDVNVWDDNNLYFFRRKKGIYCSKIEDYVDQETKCMKCIFYKKDEDSCFYPEWIPGLKKENLEKENE
jgi:hypothetical protein